MQSLLAGFDFDILPTAEVGQIYFHRSRENISERLSVIALSLVRAFGAMRLRYKNKIPHNNLSNAKLIWHTKVHAHCQ